MARTTRRGRTAHGRTDTIAPHATHQTGGSPHTNTHTGTAGPHCAKSTAPEHTGRAVIGHGTTARHDRTAWRAQHGEAAQHTAALDRPPTRNHQGTAAQRDEGPLPAVPSRLPTQTSTRSAAHDATEHACADVGDTLLTRAHSQTNPSTTSHISRCAGLCAQQPHGEWHARPPESTRTSEGTGEGLSGIGASGAHPSGAKFGKRLASLVRPLADE